ncbi:FG-GAP-like repeat-containing protein [uncultured Hymenobacter sp.]|uniref:FG-GAP-like repeat-containing protein n=1 Tax=uncultured Hymenobacter sp. TaxID=170016 RepID=UPI0035CBAC83
MRLFLPLSLPALSVAALLAVPALAQPTVVSVAPARNALAVPRAATVEATASQMLPASTTLKVFSPQAGGQKAGAPTLTGSSVSFDPTTDFRAGETLTAVLTGLGGRGHVWQFTAAVAGGTGRFTGGADAPTNTSQFAPKDMAVGDIDNDGDVDVLLPGFNTNSLGLLLNNGTGLFTQSRTLTTVSPQGLVATGDVDGDGDLDVLSAGSATAGISLLRNTGNGTFLAPITISAGSGGIGLIALGDINADGDLDLLFSTSFSSQINLLSNNGTGTFSGSTQVLVGNNPRKLIFGDLDQDGDLDFLTGNLGGQGSVSVRLNDGQGGFSTGQELPIGGYDGTVAVGDLDADGDLDVLIPAFLPNGYVSVWHNRGNASFVAGPNVPVGNAPTQLALGDVDGDRDLDIITNLGATAVSLSLNNGNGTFVGASTVAVGGNPHAVALADLDNDGDLDLLSANGASIAVPGVTTLSSRLNSNAMPTATRRPAAGAFQLWPNPADNRGVRVQLPTTASAELTLYNTLGQPVRQQTFWGLSTDLATSNLTAGLYLLTVRVAGQAPTTQRLQIK